MIPASATLASMTATDPQFREHVEGVLQGFPGAVECLRALKATFPAEYGGMVDHLYAHGPRGPRLYEVYHDRCDSDALILGRDLLALESEFSGWPADDE